MSRIFEDVKKPYAHMIVDVLRRTIEDDMPDIMHENEIEERNAYGQFRWNMFMRNLKKRFGTLGYGVFRRRGWRTPILYIPEIKFLVTFMTEDRLYEMQRNPNKGTHYLCAAAAWNDTVAPTIEQLRMELPEANIDDSWLEKSQIQMTEAVGQNPKDIKGHVLVAFNATMDKLTSVRSIRLTPNLENSNLEEDWSSFLTKPYEETKDEIQPQNIYEQDDDDMLVTIK